MLTIPQITEQFHLLFLEQLGRKIDKRFYILKGGCNLRFYFNSIRYSEDIDLDVQTIRSDTLQKNVTGILASKSLNHILQTHDIHLEKISAPKQTETTQRWKITLHIPSLSSVIHTKIEFSRRGVHGNTLFEAVNPSVLQTYHLPPIFLNHYDRQTAGMQKIHALASRHITQARDIFDLYLLLTHSSINFHSLKKQFKSDFKTALENLKNISYQNFQSQVVSFLSLEYQQEYTDEKVWKQMKQYVQKSLETLAWN